MYTYYEFFYVHAREPMVYQLDSEFINFGISSKIGKEGVTKLPISQTLFRQSLPSLLQAWVPLTLPVLIPTWIYMTEGHVILPFLEGTCYDFTLLYFHFTTFLSSLLNHLVPRTYGCTCNRLMTHPFSYLWLLYFLISDSLTIIRHDSYIHDS